LLNRRRVRFALIAFTIGRTEQIRCRYFDVEYNLETQRGLGVARDYDGGRQ